MRSNGSILSWKIWKNLVWNFAILSATLLWVHIELKNLKKFTQVLSYVFCTQLSWHVHKQITREDIRKKNQDVFFFFRKPVLFTLDLGFITPYILGSFGVNFLPDIRYCVYWVLAEIWASYSSHKICNKF